MSYLWTDKITDYYFSNPELNTVAVLWTDPEDNLVREHYIQVDESDEQWRDFVKEVSYEDIDKRTLVRHEEFREEFREAFRNYAQREDVDFNDANSTNKFEDVIIDFISEFDNTDADQKEQLFKLKLKTWYLQMVLRLNCLMVISLTLRGFISQLNNMEICYEYTWSFGRIS